MRTIPYRVVLLMLDETGCHNAEELILIHRLLTQFGASMLITTADDDASLVAAEILDFRPRLVLLHGCRRSRTSLEQLIAALSANTKPLVVALLDHASEREPAQLFGADETFLTTLHVQTASEHLGRLIGVPANERSKAAASVTEDLLGRAQGVDLTALASEPAGCSQSAHGYPHMQEGAKAVALGSDPCEDDEATAVLRRAASHRVSSSWYLVGDSRLLLTPHKILISLTPYEHKALLLMLNSDTGHVSQHIWRHATDTEKTSTSLALVISRLKRKLKLGGHELPIRTERGVGYSFVPFNALKHAPAFEPASV